MYSNDTSSSLITCKYRVRKKDGFNYIVVNGKSIFLQFDQAPKFETDLLKYFKEHFKPSNNFSNPQNPPIVYPVFLIDEKGIIINLGFNRTVSMDDNQLQFFNLVKHLKGNFQPGKIKNNPVATLYSFNFNYEELEPDPGN
jgi:hypothetical protein